MGIFLSTHQLHLSFLPNPGLLPTSFQAAWHSDILLTDKVNGAMLLLIYKTISFFSPSHPNDKKDSDLFLLSMIDVLRGNPCRNRDCLVNRCHVPAKSTRTANK